MYGAYAHTPMHMRVCMGVYTWVHVRAVHGTQHRLVYARVCVCVYVCICACHTHAHTVCSYVGGWGGYLWRTGAMNSAMNRCNEQQYMGVQHCAGACTRSMVTMSGKERAIRVRVVHVCAYVRVRACG